MTLYNINRFIILYCMQSRRKILIVCISNPAGAFCFLLFGHVVRQCFFFFNRLFFVVCSAVSDFFQACFHRKRHLCLQKLSISLQTVHPAFFSINHIRLPVFRKHFYKRFREALLFFLTDQCFLPSFPFLNHFQIHFGIPRSLFFSNVFFDHQIR